jgi:hypothetical protein
MTTFKTIRRGAVACSLTLLAASFAHAQGQTASPSSTDIYTTDFQRTFATDSVVQREPRATAATGSTDIWTTDFQRKFTTFNSIPETRDVAPYKASVDIWSMDFQRVFM